MSNLAQTLAPAFQSSMSAAGKLLALSPVVAVVAVVLWKLSALLDSLPA